MRLFVAAVPFLGLACLVGCPKTTDPPPTPNPVVVSGADCAAAEKNLQTLGCKDSRGRLLGGPNERGVPFQDVCRDMASNGVDVKATCLSKATNCEEVTSSCRL